MTRRWLRLDVEWDASEWLVGLEPAAQLAWVKLLGWVKVEGAGGTCEAQPVATLAAAWKLPEGVVRDLLAVAECAGELDVAEGRMRVTKWTNYVVPRPGPWVPNRWKLIRLEVLERDGWTCRYCGGWANQCDHVVPRAKGGTDDTDNLVAACGRCNRRKGAQTPKEWARA